MVNHNGKLDRMEVESKRLFVEGRFQFLSDQFDASSLVGLGFLFLFFYSSSCRCLCVSYLFSHLSHDYGSAFAVGRFEVEVVIMR